MSEQKQKTYKTEWTLDFDKVGQSINHWLGSVTGEDEAKTAHFAEPLGTAASASVELGLSVGPVTVKAAEADNLFEADIIYVGELDYVISGDAEKTIRLRQSKKGDLMQPVKDAISGFANRRDLRWDVRLSPRVSISLKINGGVGQSTLDLSALKLSNLEVDGGVGEVYLTLPTAPKGYDARIEGGVGHTHITIPQGTAVHMRVEGGVGGVDIHLPAGAPARVAVKGGLGGVSLPRAFARVSGGDDFISNNGVWETDNFAGAASPIRVEFNGGVGSLTVS